MPDFSDGGPRPAAARAAGATAVRLAAVLATAIGTVRSGSMRARTGRPDRSRWTVVIGEGPPGPGRGGPGPEEARRPSPALAALRALARPVAGAAALVDREPFDEEWFEHRGLRLRYEIHGAGQRVVLLTHGLLLDSQMNRRLAADLARRGNRVVLLDLPGHGRSDKPRHATAHRMDLYASTVVALLDHLGVERAVVGGVSLGANVSLHAAEIAPDRIAGLVVEMPVLEWAVPAAAAAFMPMLVGIRVAAAVLRPVASVVRRLPRTHIGTLDSMVAAAGAEPEEMAAVLHGVITGPVAPVIDARRSMRMPALVIGHQLDAIHPFADAAHLVRALPDARLVRARSIVELRLAPARLTGAIAAFLDEVWTTEPAPPAGHAAAAQRRPGRPAGGGTRTGGTTATRGPAG